MRRRIAPILISLAGACLIGLLVYGVSTRSANRTLDEAVAQGQRPVAPAGRAQAARAVRPHGLDRLARAVPRQGGRAELLGVVVRAVPGRGAAAGARPGPLWHAHGATVLGVTYLDASPDSRGFVREHRITYPNLRDTTGEFAHAYGTDQLPESFVIDRDGDIVAISRGEIDQAFLNKAIGLAEQSS